MKLDADGFAVEPPREVAQAAAKTVKRVHQELGGKSPNIILDDADLKAAVTGGINGVMMNSGQSCRAPTRMLVPNKLMDEACAIAREVAESWKPGDPKADSRMGPVISEAQWQKIQRLINSGMKEGAKLVTGGPGKPEGLEQGYFVKPTLVQAPEPGYRLMCEEIFGPVVTLYVYDDAKWSETLSVIDRTSPYALTGAVFARERSAIREVGKAMGLTEDVTARLAKSVWGAGDKSLTEIASDNGLRPDADPRIRHAMEIAEEIQDFPRHLGIHSGGMVICDRPVAEVCPVEWARMAGRTVLQWDKDDCAAIDLVKFDLLGLGMLGMSLARRRKHG